MYINPCLKKTHKNPASPPKPNMVGILITKIPDQEKASKASNFYEGSWQWVYMLASQSISIIQNHPNVRVRKKKCSHSYSLSCRKKKIENFVKINSSPSHSSQNHQPKASIEHSQRQNRCSVCGSSTSFPKKQVHIHPTNQWILPSQMERPYLDRSGIIEGVMKGLPKTSNSLHLCSSSQNN